MKGNPVSMLCLQAPVPGGEPRIFSYTDHAGIIDISLKGDETP